MGEIIIYVTASREDEAAKIARALVESRVAACVNIISNLRSIYRWEGKVQDDNESLMIIKTKDSKFDDVKKKVEELHSYSVPEIIAFPISQGAEKYLTWLVESVD
jgi:periplasmic divalent cation tolerance protein